MPPTASVQIFEKCSVKIAHSCLSAMLCSAQGQLDQDWGDLQVFWPDDETWWPGKVTALNLKKCEMTLFYETGLAHAVLPS